MDPLDLCIPIWRPSIPPPFFTPTSPSDPLTSSHSTHPSRVVPRAHRYLSSLSAHICSRAQTMSPLSNPTTTFPPASTPSAETAGCAVPSIPAPTAGEQRDTVPGLPRSRSSRSKPPVPPPTSRHASDPGHTSSGTTSTRSSVVFPGSNSTSTATTPSLGSPDLGASSPDIGTDPDAHPQRPRYHSALSRSASKTSFTGKLQSLRKKIESELSRKRPGGSRQQSSQQGQGAGNGSKSSRKAQKGTVAGLKPSPALTVPESMTVADASQLCAAKRTDCVLVVDDEEGLSGIFTAKDLAFRVRSNSWGLAGRLSHSRTRS